MSAPLNLVNLERVHKAHGTTVILDDVSLGVAAGERIGVVGRNGGGKSTLLSLLTGADEPDSGRVTRRGDLAMGVLDQTGTLPPGTTVRDVVLPAVDVRRRARVGRRPRRPLGADRPRAGPAGPRRPGRPDVRWRAPPGGAGRPADPAAGPARPRRADQPPRRRGRRLAGRVRAAARRRTGRRHPRPVVPRRGLHDHVGGRRRQRARLRRRLLGVHAGPRGAGPDLLGRPRSAG